MWRYVIFTYLLFWIMVMVLGGSAAMVFNAPPVIQRAVEALCAWAPTIVFLAMFRKLRPETSLKAFIATVFKPKPRLDLMLASGLAVVLSSMIPLFILSVSKEQSFFSFFSLKGYSLPVTLLLCLVAGPLGEELGWRAYLRKELDKKFGFIKASLVAGVIWAFWHAILWFVGVTFLGDEIGWPLVIYIISNIVVMTSLVIVMNVVMTISNNLLYAIWIHFCYNVIFYHLVNVDYEYFAWLTLIYLVTGTLFLLYHYGYYSTMGIFPSKKQRGDFMSIKTNNLGGRLVMLVLTTGFLCASHVYSQPDEQQSMFLAPMGQYQFWEMGNMQIHSPGGGFLMQQIADNDNFLNVMGFYTRHQVSEELITGGGAVFHKFSGVVNWKHEAHEALALVKSESDQPFTGGLRTFNAGVAYGKTWFEGQHYSLLLGGGVIAGEFGNLPVLPIPFIRYKLDYPILETTFEFMTGPNLVFKIDPEGRFHGTAEFSMEEFRNIRDLEFDVYAGYSLSDMIVMNCGLKNQSFSIDAAEETNDLDLSAYVAYTQLDFQIAQLTAGWAINGQALESSSYTRSLGDGFFISIIGLIPLIF